MNIKTGSKWRRIKQRHARNKGEIITVINVTANEISFNGDRSLSPELFKQRFEFVSNPNEEPKFGTQEYIAYWKKKWENDIPIENVFVKYKDKPDRWHKVKYGISFDYDPGEVRFRETKKDEPSLTSIHDAANLTVAATAIDTISALSATYGTDTCVSGSLLVNDSTTIVNNNSNTKENEMKETNITIEVNGKKIDLCKNEAAACLKPKTDLQVRKRYTIVIFSVNGSYDETVYVNAKNDTKATKKMTAILQKPANIGKTAILHKEVTALTTDIPVVKVNG